MQAVKVKRVRKIGKANTYNMEVKGHQNFSINGGLIVHNSGYGLVSYHANKSYLPLAPPQQILPWPLQTDEKQTQEDYLSW